VGAKGRLFRCFKFRSMKRDAEQILRADAALCQKYLTNHFKLPEHEDPRLTRVGRFLRKTSLDELPQLINVLLGQMSLVGPRPIVPAELDHYRHEAALVFMSLKPGITGAWAVSGRSEIGYPDRALLELEYIRRWSLLSDIAILVRTVPAVLRRRGAH
jgi:lipopolysaccharide/colanic/teichoic acid biosynthesis glycosyltransferase